MSKFVIPMAEYNRIHQIAHGVIKEEGSVERACIFFAIVGSFLLNKHYGIDARAVAGGFALCVAGGPKCIFYGKNEGGKFSWGGDGFHMWVQTGDHIIDFMAPIYQECFAIVDPDIIIPRKMFQKQKKYDSQTLDGLVSAGDYMSFPDPDLTDELINHFLSKPTNTDLLNVADAWSGSRRGKQRPTIRMGSNDGIIRDLALPTTITRGSW